ncbi:hypothetical protein R1sor_015606 [Riccia sorocarpa]|uniref:Uncharacterized protein n=1 Tax=Riccia sorocarpa TaxID=122646 RepID=A0ABD3HCQ2_9MARC
MPYANLKQSYVVHVRLYKVAKGSSSKKARKEMTKDDEYDFDLANIARRTIDEIIDTEVHTSSPPLRSRKVSVGTSQPSRTPVLEQGEKEESDPKRGIRGPSKRKPPVFTSVANLEDDESLVIPNGIPGKVALGIQFNTQELYLDFNNDREERLVEPFDPNDDKKYQKL